MAEHGNGLDDDWTTVLEMCVQEIDTASGQLPPHGHHYNLLGQWTTNPASGRLPHMGITTTFLISRSQILATANCSHMSNTTTFQVRGL